MTHDAVDPGVAGPGVDESAVASGGPAELPQQARRIVVDGRPIPFVAGDSVAIAMLRASQTPAGGGTLCLTGDCGNCIAQVDGVAYVRTCQQRAYPGLSVTRHPTDGLPPLASVGEHHMASPIGRDLEVLRAEVDVAVIGGGDSGRETAAMAERAGKRVLVLDAEGGDEVVGIYPGPMLVVRTPTLMLHVYPAEIVVATGAAEIHPVVPGNDLEGIVTARAAAKLHAAGVDLGAAVAIGTPPEGVPCIPVAGQLMRIEGDERGRVRAVVTADDWIGAETTTPCETLILGLGSAPRDLYVQRHDRRRPAGRLGSRLPGARAAQALEPGLSRDVPGRGLPAPGPCLDRGQDRRCSGAFHRAAGFPPDHPRRSGGRCDGRRLSADPAPRRASRTRRQAGPVRRLVASLALRRCRRRVLVGARGCLGR
jgi:hypothetical protein